MTHTWWKESVIYQIYPRSFKDSNGDGIGDLQGIIEKLDYLSNLGVDVLWLSPVYKSPNDDNGYDISDYYNIMKEYGDMNDFDQLLKGIHQRGMRMLMDLVVNHTSDEHQWFEESRKSKDNPYRDFYFWKPGKNGGPPNNWKSFFGGSAWEYDETTDEYYLHLFTKKQPDLNWENEKVRAEVHKILKFWLDKGVDGFRMDVIPCISKRLEFEDGDISDFGKLIQERYSNGPRVHEFLQEMNKAVLSNYDIMTVGEGPGITKELANLYVGKDRGELDMIFHFGHMFLDHGKGGRFDPLDFSFQEFKKVFAEWDQSIGEEGWINIFLDNHDFPRMVSRWGTDGKYRVKSSKLLAMLLLTMRGTPCIYQGSEIGMTNVEFNNIRDCRDIETLNAYKEHIEKGGDSEAFMKVHHTHGRDNVRTPIHWDGTDQAGFTTGKSWIKVNPNYQQINIEKALNNSHSIYYFFQEMLALRKTHKTLVYGDFKLLKASDKQLFAYTRKDSENQFLVLLNFSEERYGLDGIVDPEKAEIIIANYVGCEEFENELRGWEARLYELNA